MLPNSLYIIYTDVMCDDNAARVMHELDILLIIGSNFQVLACY